MSRHNQHRRKLGTNGGRSMKNDITCILVKVGQAPQRIVVPAGKGSYEAISHLIGAGVLEMPPLPAPFARSGFRLIVDENGRLKGLPYNRWGMVGPLLVAKVTNGGNLRTMTDQEVTAIINDLKTETQAFAPPVFGNAKFAPDYESQGGTFDPDLHFTGAVPDQVAPVEEIIRKHNAGLEAFHAVPIFGGMGFSVELQFRDREAMFACQEDYNRYLSQFDDGEDEDRDD